MHRPTIDVYEREGPRYAVRRGVQRGERAEAFGAAVDQIGPGSLRLDLGSGPGHYVPLLGSPVVALDAAHAMAAAAQRMHGAPAVQGDLVHLPFGRGAFSGAWASKAHQHLRASQLPMALAEVHRIVTVGGRFDLTVFATPDGSPTHEVVTDEASGDDLPGRLFTFWHPEHLRAVIDAAGFEIERLEVVRNQPDDPHPRIEVTSHARRTLPDHVGADMALLCCGLNPSLHAADAGVGYVTGSNRFWKALHRAGLSTIDRDPIRLLHHDRIGMTDLVKRPTARADELRAHEYREGLDRLDALCAWLQPAAVAIVGLAGWRAGADRKATVGWQSRTLGDRPVYVLPSTSGLNAGTSLAQLADHLRCAAAGPAAS